MPQISDALSIFAPNLFRDTTALVTGGGRGIGREIALAFARLGGNVVIASRHESNLKPTADDIEAMGGALPGRAHEYPRGCPRRGVGRSGSVPSMCW